MASITPTNTIDPGRMASNWTKGVQNNGQKWLDKYLAPKRAFNADPTAAQTAWQQGITRAMARNAYASGMRKANLQQAADNATNFGMSNYTTAGVNHGPKYAAKTVGLAAAMTNLRATVNAMDASTLEARIAKSAAWQRGLAALKGTF